MQAALGRRRVEREVPLGVLLWDNEPVELAHVAGSDNFVEHELLWSNGCRRTAVSGWSRGRRIERKRKEYIEGPLLRMFLLRA